MMYDLHLAYHTKSANFQKNGLIPVGYKNQTTIADLKTVIIINLHNKISLENDHH